MRYVIFLASLSVLLTDAAKFVREHARNLRVEAVQTVNCPNGFIAPGVLNAVQSTTRAADGSTALLYRCNYGMVASSAASDSSDPREFTVPCQTDVSGAISAPTSTTCVPGFCSLSPLLQLRNATLSLPDPKVGVGSSVTITCNSGYTIDGLPTGPQSRLLTCDQNLQLTTLYSPLEDNDCRPVSCGRLSLPENTKPVDPKFRILQPLYFGTTVTLACLDGYYYKPSLLSANDPAPPTSTATTFSLTCNAGGDMAPSADSPVVGECVPILCGPLPSFSSADVVAGQSDTISLGTVVQYVCHRGATFLNSTSSAVAASSMIPQPSSFRVSCIHDARDGSAVYDTDPSVGRCVVPSCPAPPTLNSSVTVTQLTPAKAEWFVGDQVQYTCAPGYMYRGGVIRTGQPSITSTCTADQVWVADDDFNACEIGSCGIIANFPKGVLSNTAVLTVDLTTKLAIGDTLEVDCEDSFVNSRNPLERSINVTCNNDGKYVVSDHAACVLQCGPLPVLPNTTQGVMADGAVYVVGGMVTQSANISCLPGYSLTGKPTTEQEPEVQPLVCNTKGSSTTQFASSVNALKACLPISCGMPKSIPNASWVSNPTNLVQQYMFGQSLVYSCSSGFGVVEGGSVVEVNITATCGESGWATSAAGCEEIFCSSSPKIANGNVINVVGDVADSGVKVGTVAEVQCDPGYAVSGHMQNDTLGITCSDSGDYVPANYGSSMCKPIQCPSLPDSLLNAVKSSSATSMKFGDHPVQYTCNPAWNLPPITVTCRADQTYEVDGEECVEPRCSSVPTALENVAVTNASASVGTVSTFSCNSGYMTSDQSLEFQAVCHGPGTWIPLDPDYSTGCSQTIADVQPILVR